MQNHSNLRRHFRGSAHRNFKRSNFPENIIPICCRAASNNFKKLSFISIKIPDVCRGFWYLNLTCYCNLNVTEECNIPSRLFRVVSLRPFRHGFTTRMASSPQPPPTPSFQDNRIFNRSICIYIEFYNYLTF